ncbi:MAG: hypothetical protein WC358_01865 [Ignavibacteria bacterium]|jgi:hypothetical protein
MNFFDWTLFKIRLIQLKREIKLLGIFHNIIISVVLILALFQIIKLYQNYYLALFTFISTVAIILLIQISRKDKSFVYLHLTFPRKAIFTEYAVLSFLFSGYLLFSFYWYFFVLVILCSAVISGIKYVVKKKTKLGFLSKLISPKNFEWISGIRKYRYTFSILYVVTLAVSPVIFLPIFCLWILTIHIFSFYEECEPQNILFSGYTKPSHFLKKKVLRHSILLFILYLPVLLINSIFNPNLIIFNLIFFIVQMTVLALTIFFKYKIYVPRDTLPGNSIFLIVIQVCTILPFIIGGIPFLLPLPLFLCFKYYFSAKENLKLYLYD